MKKYSWCVWRHRWHHHGAFDHCFQYSCYNHFNECLIEKTTANERKWQKLRKNIMQISIKITITLALRILANSQSPIAVSFIMFGTWFATGQCRFLLNTGTKQAISLTIYFRSNSVICGLQTGRISFVFVSLIMHFGNTELRYCSCGTIHKQTRMIIAETLTIPTSPRECLPPKNITTDNKFCHARK